jgi:hypothetical protein
MPPLPELEAIVTLVEVGRASSIPNFSVPVVDALKTVAPVYVFAALSVTVPAPPEPPAENWNPLLPDIWPP